MWICQRFLYIWMHCSHRTSIWTLHTAIFGLMGKTMCGIFPSNDDRQAAIMHRICFSDFSYRQVRRLLLFSSKRAQKEEIWYTANWCPGRNSIRRLINQNILSKLNGYHMEALFLPFPKRNIPYKRESCVICWIGCSCHIESKTIIKKCLVGQPARNVSLQCRSADCWISKLR